MERKLFCDILNSEMTLATGCTEPAAIALCAAYAREHLKGQVADLQVLASVNIIKNAMAAGIPGTSHTGIDYAAALGAVGGRTERQLQVIDQASDEERKKAVELVQSGHVKMGKKETTEKLYVEVEVNSADGHQAKAIIASAHTNLIYAEEDGKAVIDYPMGTRISGISTDIIDKTLSLASIYEFANTLDREIDDLHMIELAIQVNQRIAQEGAEKRFNLHVGQNIGAMKKNGYLSNDMVSAAMERTACGIDARMGGANVPVVTNSGSGNQGITATIPVVTAAEFLGADKDKTFRAVTLSHLVAIYIHCHFGLLSALCGATVAGAGAACGLVYLMGGTLEQIGYAINNMMGTVTGMLCDGAKADCAMKVATCVNTAFLSASMAIDDISVQPNEGIVDDSPDKTVKNFVRLGNDGSSTMDNIVLDIMLTKT
ncbi:L-cysteine desulfidase [Oscillibacter sp. PC13]|uniref:L-cysteine desulfidase family protein n=1 Tax=Oscillibacter sp. PC13 TaxID=1855299 RepID=UPI0008E54991|nr:L-serine ammonia-lyase, iron-sulfur-dependent, subunit alpha [Oscillibacter sp. PC13]SFP97197.1 L-cysteine desulfidase [Oscillibacter sp. PC13]